MNELAGTVGGDEEIDLALGSADFDDVDMQIAQRVRFQGLFIPFNFGRARQLADAVALVQAR